MTIYEINDNLSDFLFWIQEKYSCFNKDEFEQKQNQILRRIEIMPKEEKENLNFEKIVEIVTGTYHSGEKKGLEVVDHFNNGKIIGGSINSVLNRRLIEVYNSDKKEKNDEKKANVNLESLNDSLSFNLTNIFKSEDLLNMFLLGKGEEFVEKLSKILEIRYPLKYEYSAESTSVIMNFISNIDRIIIFENNRDKITMDSQVYTRYLSDIIELFNQLAENKKSYDLNEESLVGYVNSHRF